METMTVRLDDGLRRLVKAHAAAAGTSEGAAVRELLRRGLAADGMELYSSELGSYLRSVMNGVLDVFREEMEARNDQLEDRVARVMGRPAVASVMSAIMCVDLLRGLYEGLRQTSSAEVFERYRRQAGEYQSGVPIAEVKRRAREAAR